ncbi:MAG: hypothetical protein WC495_01230 [Patescibacteria group bacterium]|jgi:hypothetical protein
MRLLLYVLLGAIVGLVFGLIWDQMIWIGLVVGLFAGIFLGNEAGNLAGFIAMIIFGAAGALLGLINYGIGYALSALSPQHPLWIFVLVGACVPILIRLLRSRLLLQRKKLA